MKTPDRGRRRSGERVTALTLALALPVVLGLGGGLSARAEERYTPLPTISAARSPAREQILDDPDLEPVAGLPQDSPIRRVARAVGRLRIRIDTPKGIGAEAWCTATLIGADLAITAHHCIPGSHGVRAVAATLQMDALGGDPPRPAEEFPVTVTPVEAGAALEYALLRVQGRPGERFGWATLADRPPSHGEAAYVVHYPRGGPAMVSRRNCRIERFSATDFTHTCDTTWGSSGAPVFSAATGTLIGLHYAGSRLVNYGKQAAALRARSILLGQMVASVHMPSDALEAARVLEDDPLAVAGAEAVASQVREAVAALAQSSAGAAMRPAAADRAGRRGEEPLLQWKP